MSTTLRERLAALSNAPLEVSYRKSMQAFALASRIERYLDGAEKMGPVEMVQTVDELVQLNPRWVDVDQLVSGFRDFGFRSLNIRTATGMDVVTQAKPTGRTLRRSLPILAAQMGASYGVKIIWDYHAATTAFTDGKVIVLPPMPDDDDEAVDIMRGYIDHEAAHCRHTDFEVPLSPTPFLNGMQQILEDVRIEAEQKLQYPGSGPNICRLIERLLQRGAFGRSTEESSPQEVLLNYARDMLRRHVLGQTPLEESALASQGALNKRFPELEPTYAEMLFRIRSCESTAAVHQLANDIAAMLERYAKQQEEPPPPQDQQQQAGPDDQNPDQGDDPQSDTGSGGGQGDGDGDPSDGADGQDDAGASGAASSQDPGQDDGAGSNDPSSSGSQANGSGNSPGSSDIGKQIAAQVRDALQADAGAMPTTDLGSLVAPQMKQVSDEAASTGQLNPLPFHDDGDRPSGQTIDRAQAEMATSRLRSRINGLIQSSRQTRTRMSRIGRRVSTRHLHRLAVQDPRVFLAKEVRREVNTALHILLDGSISMEDFDRMRIASEAAYACALSLETVRGCAREVTRFPWSDGGVATLTAYSESAKNTIERYSVRPSGGTPLSNALWYVAGRIMCRPEPRKIVVTLTDGQPDCRARAGEILERMRATGIETVGIGIGTDACEGLFGHSIRIDNVDDLPNGLAQVLTDLLIHPPMAIAA